ncbi:glycosyl hydrolase family 28-related protein [Ereboglobus luteus]|uniref:Uncharacterized protein n=1 Tax=Ereboglobus luteus TaxID=1796921 RepID=A0A2U8E5W6_9BACT|nr:glycosyl hydrolase family 28-related protein [Ereboglobus luteus]AWI10253.1 hypothetical protein CKA38_14220 [Ereboglobus luteus]
MKSTFRNLCAFFIIHSSFFISGATGATSSWVFPGPDGRLVYETTPAGDRIMDFSHAGYKGGGVALPVVPVKLTVQPLADKNADATAHIQAAIDKVSARPPDANGFRGAVLLAPGDYTCTEPLRVNASGVVLRGSGATGPNASTIKMAGPKHNALYVGGDRYTIPGNSTDETAITDRYVPAGSKTFTVANAKNYSVGDTIVIRRTVTAEWIELLEMHTLFRNGKPQIWMKPGSKFSALRSIAAIDKNTITLDIPLPDYIDVKNLPANGATIAKIGQPVAVSLCGIENLRIQSPEQPVNHSKKLYSAIRMKAEDSWMRDVRIEETMDSVSVNGRRITLERVDVIRKARHEGSSKPAEFAPNGGQILLSRCSVEGDNVWFVATGSRHVGPIVILECTFNGKSRLEGHMGWTTGMLVDNCKLPDGGIDFKNRGTAGSGHGWGLGWSVAWNCVAKTHTIQQPASAFNWAIGCTWLDKDAARREIKNPGTFDSNDKPVTPRSLYLTQLRERLGPEALRAIGYSE